MFNRNRFILGQFHPGKALLYRLDPRTKMIFIVLIMISALVETSLPFYLILIGALLALLGSCRLGWKRIFDNLRPIFWFILLTAMFHLLFSGRDDPDIVFRVFSWEVSRTAAMMALTFSARILIFILATFVLSLTTSPLAISEGIVSLLQPLTYIKLPVYDLGMILFIALRFIPVLADEMETIRKAQYIRGVRFTGGVRVRIKRSLALILPVFFSAFRRADDLSVAIETRGYVSGRPRSSLYPLRFRAADIGVLAVAAALMASYLAGKRFLW